jgi:hypothetical protein
MKEWQIRNQTFKMLFSDTDLGDRLENEVIVEQYLPEQIIEKALEYPRSDAQELYYPAKSYAVAIIFALLLKQEFKEDIYVALSDPYLLNGDDPYFKTYVESKDIYDAILARFPMDCVLKPDQYSQNFQKTCKYFYMQFLLSNEMKIYAPAQ